MADDKASSSSESGAPASSQDAKKANPLAALQAAQANELIAQLQKMSAGSVEQGDRKEFHKFWNTQPVPDFGDDEDEPDVMGALEPDKPQSEVRQTPYALPGGFEWCNVDIGTDEELKELYDLLTYNYVEDDDAMFRFDYSADFLRWALHSPGWLPQWLCGVRATQSRKLVAFISAIPADVRIYNEAKHLVEINFLCVHKKLRSKRFAPVLIKEITRRVHQTNCFQAVYTAGIRIPRPVSICNYYHRSLNPKKLIETGFSHLGRNKSMALTVKLYKVPDAPKIPGFRPLEERDIPQVCRKLKAYTDQFSLTAVLSEEECRHWLLPRAGVMYSYVVQAPGSDEITDFVSFYNLSSSVINHPVHNMIRAAYLFYYFANANPLTELMRDALIVAKQHDFDVFNCLNIMNNDEFVDKLMFGIGDGKLHYYLYNWQCRSMQHNKMGLVLL